MKVWILLDGLSGQILAVSSSEEKFSEACSAVPDEDFMAASTVVWDVDKGQVEE